MSASETGKQQANRSTTRHSTNYSANFQIIGAKNCAKNYKIIQSVISIPKINTINTRQIRQMILNNT
jgi:hypothetical protein